MSWSHNGDYLATGDQKGNVRYRQIVMRSQDEIRAHNDVVHGVSFSPTDTRFCTGSADQTVCVWDFYERKKEIELKGAFAMETVVPCPFVCVRTRSSFCVFRSVCIWLLERIQVTAIKSSASVGTHTWA